MDKTTGFIIGGVAGLAATFLGYRLVTKKTN